MPGCVLNATGVQFDVDAFIKDSTWLKFATIFHRGDATSLRSRPVQERSGLAVGISDSDEDDLEPQIRDAMEFLQGERVEIERLGAFPGIESLELKIGLFWWRDTLCQFHTLPPELLWLAGGLGVAVTLCVYGASGNEPEAEPCASRAEINPGRENRGDSP
jgi:hypothetical protein